MGIIIASKIFLFLLSAFMTGFIIASWVHVNSGGYTRSTIYNLDNSSNDDNMREVKNNIIIRNATYNNGVEITKEIMNWSHKTTTASTIENNFQNVRILCWIMTSPTKLMKRAINVRDTWGRRCNVTLFMSTKRNDSFPAMALPVKEGYRYIWGKTREAFRYIYNNHFNDAEWFLKADDDTYVIVDNLRYFLSDKNTSDPVFYGHKFVQNKIEYMSGGGGYVLSKTALKRFINVIDNKTLCSPSTYGKSEDLELGRCLKNAGVKAGNSRDSRNRIRFIPFGLQWFVNKGYISKLASWYWRITPVKTSEGEECCSDYPISFHYIDPLMMRYLEFLIYRLRVAV